MENEIQVISKYLIEKANFLFAKKKLVMSICTDRIILQGLNSNLQSEVNLDQVDIIYYQDIKEILVEDRNNVDFTIVTK